MGLVEWCGVGEWNKAGEKEREYVIRLPGCSVVAWASTLECWPNKLGPEVSRLLQEATG